MHRPLVARFRGRHATATQIPEKVDTFGRAIRAWGIPNEVSDRKDDIAFAAIEATRMPMRVTDPRRPDNPIVLAHRAFVSMSGYAERTHRTRLPLPPGTKHRQRLDGFGRDLVSFNVTPR